MKHRIWLSILCLALPFQLSALPQQEEKQTPLTVWDFKSTEEKAGRVLSRVNDLFLEDHPEAELVHRGFFDQEYIPALRTALLAGTGPDILWLHDGGEFLEYHSYLEPLDTFLAESGLAFRESSLDSCRIGNGELKALPLTFQGIGWYYNRDLFRRAGLDPDQPPVEWHDFLAACEKLRRAGITPIATGNNRPLTSDFIRRTLVTVFFTDEEVRNFYKQGQGVNSPRFRQIMEFTLQLRDSGYLDEPGLFQPYFNHASESFTSGRSAMIPGLLSDIAHWKTFSDALGKDAVGYFPNLQHPGMSHPGRQLLQPAGILVGINRQSESRELARSYLKHLFSVRSQGMLMEELGMLIPLKDSPFPEEGYSVLKDIRTALENTGPDLEKYLPSMSVLNMQYRLDDLLINTREISLDEYLIKLNEELKLY